MGTRVQSAVSENVILKGLAFVLALTIVLVRSDDNVSDLTFYIPISLEYPENRILTTPPLDKVLVTVRGSYAKLKKFDPKSMPSISMNLSGFEDSQEIFDSKLLRVPPGLDVVSIKPAAMVVRFDERTVVDIPVKATTEGQTQSDYESGEVSIAPKTVKVIGAKSVVENLEHVKTVPISLVGRTHTFSRNVRMAPAPYLTKYAVAGQRVEVRVVVNEKEGQRDVSDVVIHVLQDTEKDSFVVSPQKVSVRVKGKMTLVRTVEKNILDAYVDARGIEGSGEMTRPIIVEAPKGITVVNTTPTLVTLERDDTDGSEDEAGGRPASGGDMEPSTPNDDQPESGGMDKGDQRPSQRPAPAVDGQTGTNKAKNDSNSPSGVE